MAVDGFTFLELMDFGPLNNDSLTQINLLPFRLVIVGSNLD